MQNQLFEIVKGTRNGMMIDYALYDDKDKQIPTSNYIFTENKYIGVTLHVLENLPEGTQINVNKIVNSAIINKIFIVDYSQEFNVYKLDDVVDSFIVSGRFKEGHGCSVL